MSQIRIAFAAQHMEHGKWECVRGKQVVKVDRRRCQQQRSASLSRELSKRRLLVQIQLTMDPNPCYGPRSILWIQINAMDLDHAHCSFHFLFQESQSCQAGSASMDLCRIKAKEAQPPTLQGKWPYGESWGIDDIGFHRYEYTCTSKVFNYCISWICNGRVYFKL